MRATPLALLASDSHLETEMLFTNETYNPIQLADIATLQEKLNYTFNNIFLLISALDRTKLNNTKNTTPDYEALEFLGDRVINLIIADALVTLHPEATPSTLHNFYETFTRNTDNSREHGSRMYSVAHALGLETLINTRPTSPLNRYGERGKKGSSNRKTKEHKLVDHVEALFGAIYLDSGKNIILLGEIFHHLFRHWLRADDHQTEYSESVRSEGDESDIDRDMAIMDIAVSIPDAPPKMLTGIVSLAAPSPTTPPCGNTLPLATDRNLLTTTRVGLFSRSPSAPTEDEINTPELTTHELFLALINENDEQAHHQLFEAVKSRLPNDTERNVVELARKGDQEGIHANLNLDLISNLALNLCFYIATKGKKTNVLYYLRKTKDKIASEVFQRCNTIPTNNPAVHDFMKSLKRIKTEFLTLEELCPSPPSPSITPGSDSS